MFKKSLPSILAQFIRLQGDLDQVVSDNHSAISSNDNRIEGLSKEIAALDDINSALANDIEKAKRIKSRISELLA